MTSRQTTFPFFPPPPTDLPIRHDFDKPRYIIKFMQNNRKINKVFMKRNRPSLPTVKIKILSITDDKQELRTHRFHPASIFEENSRDMSHHLA